MLKKIFLLFLIPFLSWAGPGDSDWTSSGGGSGMVCFKTEAAAQAYEALQKKGLPLNKELLSELVSVVTLDYWEAPSANYFKGETYQLILGQVEQQLGKHSSLLAYRYDQMARKLSKGQWLKTEKWETVPDFKLRRDRSADEIRLCRIGQLAVRYIQPTGVELMPPVKVLYDELLWNAMDVLNQALLVLHEETYYFAKAGDMQDADRSREVVRLLADQDFWNYALSAKLTSVTLVKEFERHFGDYHVRFFAAENTPASVIGTQASRYFSFKALLGKMKTFVTECAGAYDSDLCKAKLLANEEFLKALSPEENFIFVARTSMNSALGLNDPDLLYVDWNDAQFRAKSTAAMQRYCDDISRLGIEPNSPGPVAASIRYCQSLR